MNDLCFVKPVACFLECVVIAVANNRSLLNQIDGRLPVERTVKWRYKKTMATPRVVGATEMVFVRVVNNRVHLPICTDDQRLSGPLMTGSLFRSSLLLCLVACAGVFFQLLPSHGSVRCGEVSGLRYNNAMQFCMRTNIFIAAVGEIRQRTHKTRSRA